MKRSKPLTRRSPLRRTKHMKAALPRRVTRETPREKAYKAWIHREPCVGQQAFPGGHVCWPASVVEQSHERNMTGLGLKASNFRSVAMCRSLHQQWEQHTCRFSGWSKEERREWMSARIAEANARFELEVGRALEAA